MISSELIKEANKIADQKITKVVENLYKSFIDEKKNELLFWTGQNFEKYICLAIRIKRIKKYANLVGHSHIFNVTDFYSIEREYITAKITYHALKDKLKKDYGIDFNIDYWNKIKGILK